MTDLSKLYEAIDGRTPGPWTWRHANGIINKYIDEDAVIISDEECQDMDPSNCRFIALLGSCADEIKAVLQAAHAYEESSHGSKDGGWLAQSLAALAAKVKECGR